MSVAAAVPRAPAPTLPSCAVPPTPSSARKQRLTSTQSLRAVRLTDEDAAAEEFGSGGENVVVGAPFNNAAAVAATTPMKTAACTGGVLRRGATSTGTPCASPPMTPRRREALSGTRRKSLVPTDSAELAWGDVTEQQRAAKLARRAELGTPLKKGAPAPLQMKTPVHVRSMSRRSSSAGAMLRNLEMPHRIAERVAIGGRLLGVNRRSLEESLITHIVSLDDIGARHPKFFSYMHLPMDDSTFCVLDELLEAAAFVSASLAESEKHVVLIQDAGASNCAIAVAAAYFIIHQRLSVEAALAKISASNPQLVLSNTSFVTQLRFLSSEVFRLLTAGTLEQQYLWWHCSTEDAGSASGPSSRRSSQTGGNLDMGGGDVEGSMASGRSSLSSTTTTTTALSSSADTSGSVLDKNTLLGDAVFGLRPGGGAASSADATARVMHLTSQLKAQQRRLTMAEQSLQQREEELSEAEEEARRGHELVRSVLEKTRQLMTSTSAAQQEEGARLQAMVARVQELEKRLGATEADKAAAEAEALRLQEEVEAQKAAQVACLTTLLEDVTRSEDEARGFEKQAQRFRDQLSIQSKLTDALEASNHDMEGLLADTQRQLRDAQAEIARLRGDQ